MIPTLIALLLIVAAFLGTIMASDMTQDKTDTHTRFVGWVTLACSLIMGTFGALILTA